MLKKEHEVAMLPTVTNAHSEAAVPERIVCPCSVNPCCWASWHSPTPGRDQKMLGDVTGVQGYGPPPHT
ncbi:Interferon-induced transmembrane protein 3 [Pteropus alecto]|uniref:Interferon-induced transmembrane protein 3 n=1 Tax=Pteropus alecto TaxID=9402 RepID=L5KLF9_PTEAL|nr:Interferon-induced transmembrane protein 3 [Pteropus alecto]